MREFSKVSPSVWRSKKFKQLSVRGRLLFFALLAGADAKEAQNEYLSSLRELTEAGIATMSDTLEIVWLDLLGCKPVSVGFMTGLARKWIPKSIRAAVFSRDGYKCQYCGATNKLQLDHVIPVSKGGTDDQKNLATACKPCNTSKGSKTLQDWRA